MTRSRITGFIIVLVMIYYQYGLQQYTSNSKPQRSGT